MAVVSVKRSIRSGRSCAQVTGGREGNGKMYGGGGKLPLPTPLHFVLISTPMIFGFKITKWRLQEIWSVVSSEKYASM